MAPKGRKRTYKQSTLTDTGFVKPKRPKVEDSDEDSDVTADDIGNDIGAAEDSKSANEASSEAPKNGDEDGSAVVDEGDDDDPEAEAKNVTIQGPDLNLKPLSNLRDIIQDLLDTARKRGLHHFVDSNKQFYIRVGTLCSGTDAPLHALNLFGMLKNANGDQVFTTINKFACEIEPFKQGFLLRNSKPELLFRDATDFAKPGAKQAHLVSGVECEIPEVDLFIAGTSCVDFSSLNTRKTKEFEKLRTANDKWQKLYSGVERKGGALTLTDLRDDDWRLCIDDMLAKTGAKRTSTTTFASAMNYLKERQPKIVIFENVHGAPWDTTTDYIFPLTGYTAQIVALDTKNYYLPQTRMRKYVVAFNHRFFGLKAARKLCNDFTGAIRALRRNYSNTVTDFLLPSNSHELHRARNEMELASRSAQEKDTDWSFSRSRHTQFRRAQGIPDERPWIQWRENGSSNAPAKMWKPWEAPLPNRVKDLLECFYQVGMAGKNLKHGKYDAAYKAQILDCSQNVDRVNMGQPFGGTGCLTPSAIPVLTLEARPITGSEALRLQGMPIENFDMSIETQSQLQDLAGNAMSTTVVGAAILAALSCVAIHDAENNKGWLREKLFLKGDFKNGKLMDCNSFHTSDSKINPEDFQELDGLVLSAHTIGIVAHILLLGEKTRRRCVCQHILAYSSMDLYTCEICGASLCKSCKGNPKHQMSKSPASFNELGSLAYANADDALRQYFPSVLPMLSGGQDIASRIAKALQSSTYNPYQRMVLSKAVVAGLCDTIYELHFIEITEATRVEYVSKDNFILRVIIEKDQLIWYLHLDQWSETAKSMDANHKTSQPIARALVRSDASSQFPTPEAWDLWVPRNVNFDIRFRLGTGRELQLDSIGGVVQIGEAATRREIKSLEGSKWEYHPECGFPERALWVCSDSPAKLYMFLDVNPIGASSQDHFVISLINREMGRAPQAESRPVLLKIQASQRVHMMLDALENGDERDITNGTSEAALIMNKGNKFLNLEASVDGWWTSLVQRSVRVPAFSNDFALFAERGFPVKPPASLRLASSGANVSFHGPHLSCHRDQVLLIMSLPIFGRSTKAIQKVIRTLKDLDLAQQLDLAEFSRLIGPCYTAVERAIIEHFEGSRTVQLWDTILTEDCGNCAPKLPEVVWKKPAAKGQGSVVATYQTADEEAYNAALVGQPLSFRIDHSVMQEVPDKRKIPGVHYVDIRFVGRAHTLMQQARSHLSSHPGYHRDTPETRATFALGVGVLENPRLALQAPKIRAPPSVAGLKESELQPGGFKNGMALLPEQLASLQWMISREKDKEQITFVEKELAEVYIDRLRLRVIAQATRQIVRRGRVVADDVGFGKTAVCLGLIDRQRKLDAESKLQRANDKSLAGLQHLKATLVIVPNHLTQQWMMEARRFLKDANYNICVIETYPSLAKSTTLENADIIICSNQVFKHKSYKAELLKHCGTDGLDVTGSPKVYRSWYKKVHANLASAQSSTSRKVKALEYCTFARVIWDEFPYENIEVTEFVANCITSSKWMLSGTPPIATLGQVCNIAYLFNVHLARPLSLVAGRQPQICEHTPLSPLSQLEEAELYKSRPSPDFLRQRHAQLLKFVHKFFSKNKRESHVESSQLPVVLSSSTNSRSAYLELQQDLSCRTFNANLVSADVRRRLMSRLDWKEKALGVTRTMEALALRASVSFDDVKDQILFTAAQRTHATVDVARAMYDNSIQTIKDLEDRARELLGKAYYLGYRVAYIYVRNHTKAPDNGEARQFSYFDTIEKFVRGVLAVDFEKTFCGWDAFESALRILIWDEDFEKELSAVDNLMISTSLPLRSDKDAWRAKLKALWRGMRFGVIAAGAPAPVSATFRPGILDKKMRKLKTFKQLITKSPLHSRRWFRINNMPDEDLAVVLPLLQMEWEHKVPWEATFRKSNPGVTSFLVPVRELRRPAADETTAFDVNKTKAEDEARENDLSHIPIEVEDHVEQQLRARAGKSRITRAHWMEECVRRGLLAKSAEGGQILKDRVCRAEMGKASEEHWISPQGCPLKVTDLPVEGKVRIRGGNMEALFDELMHTTDNFTVLIERLAAAHGKKNFQKVIWQVLAGHWHCDKHPGQNSLSTHYVSLKCGHVHCSLPQGEALQGAICGDRGCTAPLVDVCISLDKFSEQPRVIERSDFGKGALRQEPATYLHQDGEGKGAKINAVIELIKAMDKEDQIVIFVQNNELLGDVYAALRTASLTHVTAAELIANESVALEKFKNSSELSNKKQVLVQLINSEQAAGSNLHNANHVIFVSPLITRNQGEWDAQMKQALGRCIRFRQKKTVHVYHLVVDETIEVDTLEWRQKKEIFVRPGRAVGKFNAGDVADFLERFDSQDTVAAEPGFERAISMLPRGEIQLLMGDDYVSVTMARSKETVESTNAAAIEDSEDVDCDVVMNDA